MLPLNLSDTAATSQDGSSLEFIAPIAGRQSYILMQVAEGCGYSSGDRGIFNRAVQTAY